MDRKINISSLPVAIEEAEELLIHAIQIDKTIQSILKANENNPPVGKIITANVLIGLSIEIYLKAFMIAGRNDGMVYGHKLNKLYQKFPLFLKSAIEENFRKRKKEHSIMVETALITSKELPKVPGAPPFNGVDFDDFNSSLDSLSDIFVDSRYFFENINNNNWSILKYHFEPATSIAQTLKSVLTDYKNGKFKGCGNK